MSDLSNLLGDVYGNTDPDGPPVRVEPAASERSSWADSGLGFGAPSVSSSSISDDDIATALSAALMESAPAPAAFEAPAPMVSLVEPVAAPVPVAAPAPAPMPAFQPPAPVAVAAAAPAPTWNTAPSAVMTAPVAAVTPPRMWIFGDDDIFPGARGSKAKKGRGRK